MHIICVVFGPGTASMGVSLDAGVRWKEFKVTGIVHISAVQITAMETRVTDKMVPQNVLIDVIQAGGA